jgi:hypothetical protein
MDSVERCAARRLGENNGYGVKYETIIFDETWQIILHTAITEESKRTIDVVW